ncbi:MAG TPA: HIT domain-containing protein [Anaerolineales bacterium]|nr:HIT domain-containing protein [Anaerolineales bacterium]
MRRIFASWRMKYVSSAHKEPGCIFCDAVVEPINEERLVVFVGTHAVVMLNKFPYTSGHLMVAPKLHTNQLNNLSQQARMELIDLISESVSVLTSIYKPDGFNVGANLGEAAGAGIPEHLHFHIVPRWNGDTNFMTAIGECRVLPEDLSQTYQKVKDAFQVKRG